MLKLKEVIVLPCVFLLFGCAEYEKKMDARFETIKSSLKEVKSSLHDAESSIQRIGSETKKRSEVEQENFQKILIQLYQDTIRNNNLAIARMEHSFSGMKGNMEAVFASFKVMAEQLDSSNDAISKLVLLNQQIGNALVTFINSENFDLQREKLAEITNSINDVHSIIEEENNRIINKVDGNQKNMMDSLTAVEENVLSNLDSHGKTVLSNISRLREENKSLHQNLRKMLIDAASKAAGITVTAETAGNVAGVHIESLNLVVHGKVDETIKAEILDAIKPFAGLYKSINIKEKSKMKKST